MGTVIIDVGTHKFEELNILFSPSRDEFATLFKTTIKKLIAQQSKLFSHFKLLVYYFKSPAKSRTEEYKNYSIRAQYGSLLTKTKKIKKLFVGYPLSISSIGT